MRLKTISRRDVIEGTGAVLAGTALSTRVLAAAPPTDPMEALEWGVDLGLSRILESLKATSGGLDGPLKSDKSVDAALRAAYCSTLPVSSTLGSDDMFRKWPASMVKDHFGLLRLRPEPRCVSAML